MTRVSSSWLGIGDCFCVCTKIVGFVCVFYRERVGPMRMAAEKQKKKEEKGKKRRKFSNTIFFNTHLDICRN